MIIILFIIFYYLCRINKRQNMETYVELSAIGYAVFVGKVP